MDNRVKRIEEIKNQISIINFNDHMCTEDYETTRKLKNELNEILKSLVGYKGWVCKVTPKYNRNRPFYFTGNKTLCCCDEPTFFESKEEAEWLFAKSDLSNKGYDVEYYIDTYK